MVPTAEEGNVEDLAWNVKKVEEFLAKAQEEAEKRRSGEAMVGWVTELRVQPLDCSWMFDGLEGL